MFIAELFFKIILEQGQEVIEDAIYSLLGPLRLNGQVLGREFPIAESANGYLSYLMLPDNDSLDAKYNNEYVERGYAKLSEAGLEQPVVNVIGFDPTGAAACRCSPRQRLILYTTYLSLESPIRCGVCFRPVPLYQIPPTSNSEYSDILSWQSDYQACDTLQMNCATGERFATKEMSKIDSSLSRRGIEICKRIAGTTGIKTYYYIYRSTGRSSKSEQQRKCPSCGKEWLLEEPQHRIFDFCCNNCLLLSNIAWEVRG